MRDRTHLETVVVPIVALLDTGREKSIQVQFPDGSTPYVPRSQVQLFNGRMAMPRWLADRLFKRKRKGANVNDH